MMRIPVVLLVTCLAACGSGGSAPIDPRDAIANGATAATAQTYWYSSTGIPYRIAFFADGTCVEQAGLIGNGTRQTFTWTKVAPDLIVVNTPPPGGVCYLSTIRAISGSFQTGTFSATVDENGCNTAIGMTFWLTGGPVP